MMGMTAEQAYLRNLRSAEEQPPLEWLKKAVARLDTADEVMGFRLVVDLRHGGEEKGLTTGSGGGSLCWAIDEHVIGA